MPTQICSTTMLSLTHQPIFRGQRDTFLHSGCCWSHFKCSSAYCKTMHSNTDKQPFSSKRFAASLPRKNTHCDKFLTLYSVWCALPFQPHFSLFLLPALIPGNFPSPCDLVVLLFLSVSHSSLSYLSFLLHFVVSFATLLQRGSSVYCLW